MRGVLQLYSHLKNLNYTPLQKLNLINICKLINHPNRPKSLALFKQKHTYNTTLRKTRHVRQPIYKSDYLFTVLSGKILLTILLF